MHRVFSPVACAAQNQCDRRRRTGLFGLRNGSALRRLTVT